MSSNLTSGTTIGILGRIVRRGWSGAYAPSMGAFRARAGRTMSAVVIVAVAACGSDLGGLPFSIALENRTAEAISVIWHRDSGDQILIARDVPAGESGYLDINQYGGQESVCGDGELVAIDAAGRVVARRPMFCTHWLIESTAAPE